MMADVRFCFKHNPLPFHRDAEPASTAALAAGAQGRYWPMHDVLMANQRNLERADLESYARKLGLDMTAFKRALDQGASAKQIQSDMDEAAIFGARGTPTFFINGRRLLGAQPFEKFEALIVPAAAKADRQLRQGTPRSQLYARLTDKGVSRAPDRDFPRAGPPPRTNRYRITLNANERCRGPSDAKVTIVEYGDYQCPYCARIETTLKALMESFDGDVRVCFRNNPLPFHPFAIPAAEAALAAGDQGRYWQMHNLLFSEQEDLSRETLDRLAGQLHLDMTRYHRAMDNLEHKALMDAEAATAREFAVKGTPVFFINGTRLNGAERQEVFKALVEIEINAADALIQNGTPRSAVYERLIAAGTPRSQVAETPPPTTTPKTWPVTVGRAYVRGNANAPVTIIAFMDFQCPYCSRASDTIKKVQERYGDKVRVAVKHNPLPFHGNARLAAKAALAAGEQGRFWEMYDKAYANQLALDRNTLLKHARSLNLDMARFEMDLGSDELDGIISEDMEQAKAVGAKGTPTFFINGRRLTGAQPLGAFVDLIDDELHNGVPQR